MKKKKFCFSLIDVTLLNVIELWNSKKRKEKLESVFKQNFEL